ncbi:hypothetical protein AKJ52_00630 [candidate division MSBL1 archaeon SCGC-AAA382C18]|uniref:Nucleotidyl transferase domain-containing protein n=1 Tax=candidate division MSBL1 archaeon SCGC-AAA382C18 TaxID=1698281 RepID=A0A133VLF7_9EURY|nr:hypothetical protein AKJ52_00630 [candidate division MSBL1 archaeon SCGC-AAA382C18]
MKALILAGGYATRLWPVTKHKAKPLLPLVGKPILSYILDEMEDIDKINEILIATNERFEESFKQYLSDREGENYRLIIESQEAEGEKYGAVGGIINAIEKGGDDDYIVIGGDNYYSFKIRDFLEFAQEKDSVANACFQVPSFEEAKNYGIVDFDEDKKIREFQEKPENPKSRMASTACYYYPREKLELFDKYVDYWDGKIPEEQYLDEPGRFLEWTVERYDTYAYPFEGKWVDVGTRGGYLRAETELRKENIVKGQVKNSEIGENVTVLENCKIQNSEIENSIIFENCKIQNSIIKNTIVGDNTEIKNKDVREALIKDIEE